MKISLRRATAYDSEMLWHWRNDYDTRQASINSEPVLWPEHMMWLAKSLQSSNRKILIAEYDGQQIGTVRFDFYDKEAELSWTVAPEHRGKGYGVAMLRAAIAKEPKRTLIAKIKPENGKSVRIAQAAGFKFYKKDGGLGVWRMNGVGADS